MTYNKETVGVLPPHVRLMLKTLDVEEKDIKKRHSLLGKKIMLNEKTIGCTCQLKKLCDEHKGKQFEVEFLTFSNPTISNKEPVRFKNTKIDD